MEATRTNNANSLGLRDLANLYLSYKMAKTTGQAQLAAGPGIPATAPTSATAQGVEKMMTGGTLMIAVAVVAVIVIVLIVRK